MVLIGMRLAAVMPTAASSPLFSQCLEWAPQRLAQGPCRDVAVADVDNDGNVDVVVADGTRVVLRLGRPGAAFEFWDEVTALDGFQGVSQVVPADVNGDGHIDIVASSQTGDAVLWLENDGRRPPAFSTRPVTSSVPQPSILAAGDFDGDGSVDVFASGFGDDKRVQLANDGLGPPSFTGTSVPDSATLWADALAVDLNGDGFADLVGAVNQQDEILVYSGGPGGLTLAVTLADIDSPTSVAVADMNGDGVLDIVVGTYLSGVHVFLGRQDMAFERTAPFELPSGGEYRLYSIGVVVAADFNGDGLQDVLLFGDDPGTVEWIPGDGSGTLAGGRIMRVGEVANAIAATAADLDGDGLVDAVAADGDRDAVVMLRSRAPEQSGGNASFSFTRADEGTVGGAVAVASGDLNGDGHDDLVVASRTDNRITLFLAPSAAAATANADAARPMVPAAAAARILVDEGTIDAPSTVAIADIDGDGVLDLVVAGLTSLWWFRGTGANGTGLPHFEPFLLREDLYHVPVAVPTDVDGDGDLDIVFASSWAAWIVWLEQVPDATATSGRVWYPHTIDDWTEPSSLAVADVNGDGVVDIVAHDYYSEDVVLFESAPPAPDDGGAPGEYDPETGETWTRARFLPARTISSLDTDVVFLAVADINGDARPDVLILSNYKSTVVALLNGAANEAGGFHRIVLTSAILTPASAVVADVDRDGYADVVITDSSGPVVLMQGRGKRGSVQVHGVDVPIPELVVATILSDMAGASAVAVSRWDLRGGSTTLVVLSEAQSSVVLLRCASASCTGGTGRGLDRPCRQCFPGEASGGGEDSVCAPCAPGSAAPAPEMTSCVLCPSGTYSDAPGRAQCTVCPDGFAGRGDGAASPGECARCPRGTFTEGSNRTRECTPCPEGRSTAESAAGSVRDCDCDDGAFPTSLFVAPGAGAGALPQCTACPAGANCVMGRPVEPLPGFWWDPAVDAVAASASGVAAPGAPSPFGSAGSGKWAPQMIPCIPAAACRGGSPFLANVSMRCLSAAIGRSGESPRDGCGGPWVPAVPGGAALAALLRPSSPAGVLCAPGYEGERCSACAPAHYRAQRRCKPCGSGQAGSIALLVLAVVLCCLLVAALSRMGVSVAPFTISFDFFQLLARYASLSGWGTASRAVLDAAALVGDFDVGFARPECLAGIPFAAMWVAAMAVPVAAALLLAGVRAALALLGGSLHRSKLRFGAELLLLAQLVYMPMAARVMQIWDCVALPNGQLVLEASPDLPCGSPTHDALLVGSAAAAAFYIVGIPLLFAALLLRYEAAARRGDDDAVAFFAVVTSPLTLRFRREHRRWILVVMLRKLLVAMCATFNGSRPQFQLASMLIVLVLANHVQLANKPFRSLSPKHGFRSSARRALSKRAAVSRGGAAAAAAAPARRSPRQRLGAWLLYAVDANHIEETSLLATVCVLASGIVQHAVVDERSRTSSHAAATSAMIALADAGSALLIALVSAYLVAVVMGSAIMTRKRKGSLLRGAARPSAAMSVVSTADLELAERREEDGKRSDDRAMLRADSDRLNPLFKT